MALDLPEITAAEVHRFERAARIENAAAFVDELNALMKEKVASAEREAESAALTKTLEAKADALRAGTRWSPSATDIQRGRSAMLKVFEAPQNLPLPEFARLAHKSRQQIYKDLSARPRRLLALNVGPRRQRLPDWQLDPLRLRLTREVLEHAPDIDPWTAFHALSDSQDGLDGHSPIEMVNSSRFDFVLKVVLDALGIQKQGPA